MSCENMHYTTPEAARAEIEYLINTGYAKAVAEEKPEIIEIDEHTYTAFRGE